MYFEPRLHTLTVLFNEQEAIDPLLRYLAFLQLKGLQKTPQDSKLKGQKN